MKILWVKGGKLLPVDTGGKIRSYNIARHLAKNHELTLLSYYDGRRDFTYEAAIRKRLPGTHSICTSFPESTLRQALDYIWRLGSRAPYAVTKFTHPAVQHTVARWLNERKFDVAVSDFLSASLNFPEQSRVPCVLFQHNVETLLWRRMFETETAPLRKLAYRIEAAKMEHYEKTALGRFQHVIAVSQNDRDEMLRLCPGCPITIIPTGVDMEHYKRVPSAAADPPLLVFTGSMDWEPNVDAVQYFCREIWPRVLSAFPNARFQIVGRNPHSPVRRLKSASVEITGSVASVADYLRPATVVVVPLRIGGGTRLKIFEAMAMGKAVVSTSIGAEGLDVTHGRDLLIADTPQDFSDKVLHLLREPDLRRQYEEAAAAMAAHHDWSEISRSFADVLRHTMVKFHDKGAMNDSAIHG